jgi:predicted nucleic acid-binding protein
MALASPRGASAIMPAVVLDSSIAMAWVLDDEESALANHAVEAAFHSVAHVPALWLYEVQNVLALAVRRRRITLDDALEACDALASIPVRIHAPQGVGRELALATPSAMTAHDAAYLCIARDTQAPLATLDEPLRAAAHAHGVRLFEA